jgi:hypothetical protein
MLFSLAILLPIAAFLGLFVFLTQHSGGQSKRSLVLRAALLSTAYLVLALETLSLFKGITWADLAVTWLLPGAGLWLALLRRHSRGHPLRLPGLRWKLSGWEWVLAGILATVLAVTFLVAWITPPQTWDSLSYHLSRVAHWAQNRSIGHYQSGIERQNSMSPGAELLVLNSYVLTGSDRLANFPQWLAMLGSLAGVSLAAGLLGANRFGQWLAAAFAATLPIGIAQASSTTTDYVATFWTVCVAVEALQYAKNDDPPALFYASLAAALAVMTKPVVIPYLMPFAAWIAVVLVRRRGWRVAGKWAAAAVIVVLTINAGYLGRNLITYGHIANPSDLDYHSNQLRNLPGLISITLRNAGLQAGLPNAPAWNEIIYKVVLRVHLLLDLGLEDPRTTLTGYFQVRPPSTHENTATNPYHAYLIVAVLGLMLPLRKRIGRQTALYAACIALGFLLFSFIYKWQIFGVRFLLPFFVLCAPVAGQALSKLRFKLAGGLIAVSLFVLSFPWLLRIDSRPLLPQPNQGVSILAAKREQLYAVNDPWAFDKISQVSQYIQEQGCEQVGLMLHGDDPEYWYWVALGAPRDTLRIEWIVSGTPSTRYQPDDFQPCAVLCKGCGADPTPMRGLPLDFETSGYTVYMQKQ